MGRTKKIKEPIIVEPVIEIKPEKNVEPVRAWPEKVGKVIRIEIWQDKTLVEQFDENKDGSKWEGLAQDMIASNPNFIAKRITE